MDNGALQGFGTLGPSAAGLPPREEYMLCKKFQDANSKFRGNLQSSEVWDSQAVSQPEMAVNRVILPSSVEGGGRYRWNRADLGLPNLLTPHAHIA